MKIICVNGPPRSGKDTLCHMLKMIIKDAFPLSRIEIEKFAFPLNEIARVTIGMNKSVFKQYREEFKDDPLPHYSNITMRDLLIYISENYCKVLFGNDYFAIQAFNRIQNYFPVLNFVLFSDSGFQFEFDVIKKLAKEYKFDDVSLIRLMRDGCNYDNDSREYVENTNTDGLYIINNNGTINELYEQVHLYFKKEINCEISIS